jgi:hypothetical protein
MSTNAGNPNPVNAAIAPASPRTFNPVYAATCIAVAPGNVWHNDTPLLNVASSSQFSRTTAMVRMYATIAGPPNAVSPSRRKRVKIFTSGGVVPFTPGDDGVIESFA